jgi:hypothetical protein
MLISLQALVLIGCGDDPGRAPSAEAGSFLGRACAIEIGFERHATRSQQQAFKRRVESLRGVARVQVLPRERVIELFIAELHREGYTGKQFDYLATSAIRYAGATLVATPVRKMAVPAIIRALQELPASVESVNDRSSCANG